MDYFRKTASRLGIATEAASLRWLAAAEAEGGAPVARLGEVGETWLTTVRLRPGRATPEAAAAFGRALAATHRAGADWFGAPPPGLVGDGDLAGVPLPMRQAPPSCWGEFYATDRILPYVRIGFDRGALDSRDVGVLERLCNRLTDGEWDSPQPHGCPSAARVHGDLWGGNVLWAIGQDVPGHETEDTVGVLIDPAAHGGHAETDLAALAVFGSPSLPRTIAAYNEVAPLADGWESRVTLHQIHMLAVHVALFGGSYGPQTVSAAGRYL